MRADHFDQPTNPYHYVLHCIGFFFNDTATTEIYTNLNTLSLHDSLPVLLLPIDCVLACLVHTSDDSGNNVRIIE